MQKMEKADGVKSNTVGLLLRLVVKDRNGKILSDTGHKPSKSFVIQFLEAFYGIFRGANQTGTATDNSEHYVYRGSASMGLDNFRIDADAGQASLGIVVGRNVGSSPEGNMDYKLDSQCAQGSGTNQFMHGVQSIGEVGEVGVNVDWELYRVFTNLSGATIEVKEVGIQHMTRHDGGIWYYLDIRDVITTVAVPDNCSLTVYYTIRTTV